MDPAFVTLGSVPFLLMRGLPRVGALQACFTVHGPLLDPDSPVITRLPIMYHHTDNNVTHVALDARISPGVQCLMALPYKLPENFTLFDADGNIRPGAQSVIQESLVSVRVCEKCARRSSECHGQDVKRHIPMHAR